jgi:hypothetical protein
MIGFAIAAGVVSDSGYSATNFQASHISGRNETV